MNSPLLDRFQGLRLRLSRLTEATSIFGIQRSVVSAFKAISHMVKYQDALYHQQQSLLEDKSRLAGMRAEYRQLFEFAPIGYLIFNRNGVVIDINATGLEMLKTSQLHLLRQPFLNCLHHEERIRFLDHIEAALTSDDRHTCKLVIQRADGSTFHAEVQSARFYSEKNRQMLIRTALLDVSERQELEQQLIEEREKALESARLTNEFMANMSHEIRTPLAGVIGFAQVLEDELEDEHQEVAQIIASGGNRLLNTLNSVLDFSRLQARNPKILLMPINLVECARQQCRLLYTLARQQGLTLTLEAEADEIYVQADVSFVERIVSNLIDNAIKYTSVGSIRVIIKQQAGWVSLTVEDTGIGIDQANISLIMEPFRQLHLGDDRAYGGVGLGLSITKRLTELMQGELKVESKPGIGSRLTVNLRVPDQDLHVQNNTTREKSEVETLTAFKDCNLLVVEDNWETMLLVKRLLKPVCKFTAVQTFDEAIEAFKCEHFNMALIDVNLGEHRTGTDLLHVLRALPDASPFYSIAFTAYALPSDHALLLSRGFDDYLSKPFTKSNLLSVLARAESVYA